MLQTEAGNPCARTPSMLVGVNFNTNIIAVEFFNQLFPNRNNGYAAAIVVMLLIVMIPILVFTVRQFRAEEAAR